VGCFMLAGAVSAGCTVYEELASPSLDASRERNFEEASKPPREGGVEPGDATLEASVDASEDDSDGQGDDVGATGVDASADRTEEDMPGRADSAGPITVDVTEAGPETSDGSDESDVSDARGGDDASFDGIPEIDGAIDVGGLPDVGGSPDVGGPPDADAGPALDVFEAGPTGPSLIDDMEDDDNFILPREGRQGVWFTVNDGTPGAIQTPGTPFTMSAIPAGRDASLYAARSTGHSFASWRPLMGFWFLQPPTGPKQIYDVSRYRGVTFFARLAASDAAQVSPSVRVVLPDRATDPDGMVCTGAGCSDHFGANIVLTPQWTSYTILFATMTQEGWGTQAAQFDAANAYGVEFEFPVQATFDCWIDDIAFVP